MLDSFGKISRQVPGSHDLFNGPFNGNVKETLPTPTAHGVHSGASEAAEAFLSQMLPAMEEKLTLLEQNYVLFQAILHFKSSRQRRYEDLMESAMRIADATNGLPNFD